MEEKKTKKERERKRCKKPVIHYFCRSDEKVATKMGNKNSNIRTSNYLIPNDDHNSSNDDNVQYEQFYIACATGNLNKVRELLPRLPKTRINLIKYQDKSAIDAAAENGHQHVVQYLLNYDYFREPLIDPTTERHEQLTKFLLKRFLDSDGRYIERDLNECVNFQPSFENVREHTTVDHAQASQLLMRIATASRIVRPFVLLAVTRECADNLREIIDDICHQYDSQSCDVLRKLYADFRDHNNINSLIEIYTLTTPPMSTILRSNSGSYTALIYLHLNKLKDRAFNSISYRGLKESPLNLEHYRSAMKHGHIVELNNLTSTSKLREIADIYSEGKMMNAHLMIIKFDFTENSCSTALDLAKEPCISHMTYEEEVLMLPHTLFRVTNIEHMLSTLDNPHERPIITFKHMPVIGGRSLNSFILKRSRLVK